MGKNILLVAVIAVAAYFVGVESAKSRGKNYEDLRHQLERLWTSPEARKSRQRAAKKARKAMKKTGRKLGRA
ncbi:MULTISPECIES: hypothetical protein [Microbacterium]|jgi:hypothetical protein|uniref:hypothetical protein n=1 Tax=Microbacterium TaxID=33882 RepID=UPI001E4E48BA|nr:hypothetical protein [Microbacterium nymphoidis]MCD2499113.1 hypothetical protein [Microbacterium nymphoidis]MDR2293802.1 hypothetical protein [Microbacterium sp.]